MKALAILQQMDYESKRDLFKGVPNYAIPRTKFSDRTANELTIAILAFLKLRGHMTWRQSSEGRYRPGKEYTDVLGHVRQMKGTYLPGQNNGQSDLAAIVGGQFIAIEIKNEGLTKPSTETISETGGGQRRHVLHCSKL